MSKYRSRKEQETIYEAWKQSGLTKAEFCRQNNLHFRSLGRWLKNLKKDKVDSDNANTKFISKPKGIKFLPINSPSINPNNNNHNKSFIEVTLPSGIGFKVHLSENITSTFLRELLK